jgi:hypothetical protein
LPRGGASSRRVPFGDGTRIGVVPVPNRLLDEGDIFWFTGAGVSSARAIKRGPPAWRETAARQSQGRHP